MTRWKADWGALGFGGGLPDGNRWGLPERASDARHWREDRRPLPRREPGEIWTGNDRGSVTPLVIGMLVCLLLLTAGVTAAGSAFLAGQRLQRLCDGAVAAAVGAVDPRRSSAEGVAVGDPIAAADHYLRVRGPDVGAVVAVGANTISARCSNEAPITFGVLFGSPTLARTVTSTSRPILKESALGGGAAGSPQRQVALRIEGTLI